MLDFMNLTPVMQALLGGGLGWIVTALGASLVFFTNKFNRKMFDLMLGFAAGVMIAASFWSLLAPSIELASQAGGLPSWLVPAIGFFLGAMALLLIDKILPHVHIGFKKSEAEGIRTPWHKNILLILAITMHNIPEGLAVGIAFGAVAAGIPGTTMAGAIALTIGIAIQNFPEGIAVAMPLRKEGKSKFKSFWYGHLSGIVEPIAAVFGAVFVLTFRSVLPYALAFAAGAMIFVVVEQIIPESHQGGNRDLATMGTILGFILMMMLDVGFA